MKNLAIQQDKQIAEYLKLLREFRVPYTYVIKGNKRVVTPHDITDFQEISLRIDSLNIKRSELWYIRTFQQSIQNRNILQNFTNTAKPYFSVLDKIYLKPEKVVAIDLNEAYHNAAKRIGIYDNDLLNKSEKVSKGAKRVAFGSLATKTITETYNGDSFEYDYQQKETAPIYFAIANEVSNVMIECINKLNCIGFYTDCIYAYESEKESILDFLASKNIQNKIEGEYEYCTIIENKMTFYADNEIKKVLFFEKFNSEKNTKNKEILKQIEEIDFDFFDLLKRKKQCERKRE